MSTPPSIIPALELPKTIYSPTKGNRYDTTIDMPVPNSVLAIGAHPDDIELGSGGTLAKWASEGSVINYLILTDGSKGTWDNSLTPQDLIEIRYAEQLEAVRILSSGSMQHIHRLDAIDGELDCNRKHQRTICRLIRLLKPDVVIGHDPWRRYRLHPDHRNAGFITIDAIVAARDHSFFPELSMEPHRPQALLLFEADQPNHIEDTSEYLDTKVSALLAHRSQMKSTFGISDDTSSNSTRDDLMEIISYYATHHAQLTDSISYGEAFHLITEL